MDFDVRHTMKRTALSALISVCMVALTACGGSARSPNVDTPQAANATNAGKVRQTAQDVTSCLVEPALPQLPSGGLIDVTDFGAAPNDDVDDTVYIQRAIDSARKGQWVYFPPGRYLQSRSLSVLQPGITLWGAGAILHATNPADQAILLKADEGRVFGFTLTAVTQGRRSEPWTSRIAAFGLEAADKVIRGIVIQNNRIVPGDEAAGRPMSNGSSAAGIMLLAVRDFTVSGNTIRRSLSDGIHITGASSNGRVLNNHVSETGDDMIAVVSYLDRDWQARSAQSASWLKQHLDTSVVRHVWISGNTVSDAYWGRGVSVVGGQDVTVADNQVQRVAMAAGILVAREDGFHTHGVNNVLVKGNQISDVQTTQPSYVPVGSDFSELLSRLANNGGRTSHAAIEIHNTTPLAQLETAKQQSVLGVSNVVVQGNTVMGAYRDGVRIGADSHPNSISLIGLYGNRVDGASRLPFDNLLLNNTMVALSCAGNRANAQQAAPAGCLAEQTVTPLVTGARLNCGLF